MLCDSFTYVRVVNRVESAYKSRLQAVKGLAPEGMSAVHQSAYAKRFVEYFEQHVDVQRS